VAQAAPHAVTPPTSPTQNEATEAAPAKPAYTDGPEAAFSQAYDNLTKVQRAIVDKMAARLSFDDLFKKRRFQLKFDILPGTLQATFVSMTQEENEIFWKQFRDTALGKFEIELMINLNRCIYTVTELNGSPIPPENRSALFKSFDSALVHTLSNYSSLFELAKMKVLYGNFLEIQGV